MTDNRSAATFLSHHLLPATFFVSFSLWWIVCIFLRYRRSIKRGRFFHASASYRLILPASASLINSNTNNQHGATCFFSRLCYFCIIISSRLPVEGVLKLLTASVGTVAQLTTGWDDNRQRFRLTETQHGTIYLLYGISGLADILVYCRAYFVPKSFDYTGLAFAFLGESLLLSHYVPHEGITHGSPVEMVCNHLLFYTIFACFLLLLLEQKMPESLTIALARPYAFLLHGAWFATIGFILSPPWSDRPVWNLHDFENVVYIVAVFCGISMGLFIVTLLIGAYILAPIRDHLEASFNTRSNNNNNNNIMKCNHNNNKNVANKSENNTDKTKMQLLTVDTSEC